MHRVQNGECLHYRARSSSPLTFAGALRDVVIVGQERETRCHPPPPSTAPHVQGADNSVDGDDDDEDEECVICSGSLNADDKPVSAIQACEHKFHDACIRGWLERLGGRTSPHCPVCRAEVPMRPKPLSPSGTMTIQLGDDVCPGFEQNTTCIEIIYNLPTGRQHVVRQNLDALRGDGVCRLQWTSHFFLRFSFTIIPVLGTQGRPGVPTFQTMAKVGSSSNGFNRHSPKDSLSTLERLLPPGGMTRLSGLGPLTIKRRSMAGLTVSLIRTTWIRATSSWMPLVSRAQPTFRICPFPTAASSHTTPLKRWDLQLLCQMP
jgi:hypothetical protein